MAYSGIHRLRMNMEDGSIVEGSGEVVSQRAEEGTSVSGYTAADLQGITPFTHYGEFIEATKSK